MDKATVIAITNNKGGCGKTTSACCIAAAMAEAGRRVLLIDMDGQSNVSAMFVLPVPELTMYDVMTAKGTIPVSPDRVAVPSGNGGSVDVIQASENLSAVEVETASNPDRATRLLPFVEQYKNRYDYILIDTPPALGLLTINALFCADRVIVPMQPQPLSLKGMTAASMAAVTIGRNRGRALPYRVLFTMFDRRRSVDRAVADGLEKGGTPAFRTRVRAGASLSELAAVGGNIFASAPKSNGAEDYRNVTEEIFSWE